MYCIVAEPDIRRNHKVCSFLVYYSNSLLCPFQCYLVLRPCSALVRAALSEQEVVGSIPNNDQRLFPPLARVKKETKKNNPCMIGYSEIHLTWPEQRQRSGKSTTRDAVL